MNMNLPFSRKDMALHKLPALLLGVAVLVGVSFGAGAHYFRNSQAQALLLAQATRSSSEANLKQAEDEKQTIKEYITRFQQIKAEGLMDEENRLDLVEAIGRTRDRYKLYPVQLDIEQQHAVGAGPDGQDNSGAGFSLRASRIRFSLPMLHEEDLSRFFDDFYKNKGLFVVESCAVKPGGGGSSLPGNIELGATMTAACQMHWLTIRQTGGPTSGH